MKTINQRTGDLSRLFRRKALAAAVVGALSLPTLSLPAVVAVVVATALTPQRAEAAGWESLGAAVGGTPNFFTLAVDASGIPYLSYVDGIYHNIAKWDGNAWSTLGASGDASAGAGADLAVSSNGDIVRVAIGFIGSFIGLVQKWNGGTSAWDDLGSGFTGHMQFPALTVDASGNVFLSYQGSGWGLAVRKWDGSGWASVGSDNFNPGNSGSDTQVNRSSIQIEGNGHPIVAFEDQNYSGNYGVTVMRWDGASWNLLGSRWAASGGANTEQSYVSNLRIADDGSIYVAYVRYEAGAGGVAVTVRKWDSNSSSWTQLGTSISTSQSVAPLDLDASGNPWVGYSVTDPNTGFLSVGAKRWNGTAWDDTGAQATGGSGSIDSSRTLVRGQSGKFYTAYLSSSDGGHVSQYVPGPSVTSINRAAGATNPSNATTANFIVTFSGAVSNVDASDFALTATGSATGTIGTPTTTDNIVYTVPVTGISGTGTLRLDLNASGTGIVDASSNAIGGGFTSGQTFSIDQTTPTTSAAATVSGSPTSSAASFTATLDEAGTGYWIVVAQGATAPTSAEVKAGISYTGGTVVQAGNAAMTASTQATFNIAGLTPPGTAYTAYFVAEDSAGNLQAAPGNFDFSTAATVPAAPSLTVTPGNAQATLSFATPGANGAALTGYTVTLGGGASETLTLANVTQGTTVTTNGYTATVTSVSGGNTVITVTGLANGSGYTFAVGATNSEGTATSTTSASNTPASLPDQPVVTIAGGNAQATLSFATPNDGGSALTGYTVVATPSGGSAVTLTLPGVAQGSTVTTGGLTATVTSVAGGNTVITVTSLANGTAYSFTVAASNAIGGGTASTAPANPVTPATVPAAPSLTVTPGNAQATLSFATPGANGAALAGYTVTLGGGATQTLTLANVTQGTTVTANGYTATVTSVSGGNTVITVTGLANGSGYTFAVGATNSVGTTTSSTSASNTPASLPDQPVVTIAGGNAQATLTFPTPNNGGSALTGYTVVATPSGGSAVTLTLPGVAQGSTVTSGGLTATVTSVSGGNTVITVTSLANGTAYSFTAAASNATGGGSASTAPANPVTPSTVPAQPSPTVVAGHEKATLTFATPDNGGAALSGYDVVVTPTGGGAAVTLSLPSVAQGTTVTAGGYTATVTSVSGGNTVVTVTGLTNGTPQDIVVTAKNANGGGTASTAPGGGTTPNPTAPDQPVVTIAGGNAQATLSFPTPAANGSPLTGYTVIATPSGGSAVTLTLPDVAQGTTVTASGLTATVTSAAGGNTVVTVTSLANGTGYSFTVAASNGIGAGTASTTPAQPITPAAPSSGGGDAAPPAPTVTPGSGGGTVTTINTGGNNVPVVQSGTITVTATASNQSLLATTQTTTGTGGTSTTTPAIVVTANQSGATATGSAGTGSGAAPTIQLTGDTTVTVQSGAQVSGTALQIVPPTNGGTTQTTVNVGGQSLIVAAATPGETVTVSFATVTVNGQSVPVLQVTGGSASFTAGSPGQPLLAMGDNAATAGSCANQASNVVTRLDEQGRITEATVTQCYIVLPSGAFRSTRAATERRLWAGEQALWDQDGLLTIARLGSPASNRGWTGDPLAPVAVDGLTFAASVPKLAGDSTRLGADVEQHFFAQLAALGLTRQAGTDGFGVFFVDWQTDPANAALLDIPNRDYRYVAMPIGRVTVDVSGTTADGVSLPGNGDYRFTKDGLSITVAPAVADLTALAAYVKQLGGGVTVQEDGSYLIELDGRHYALQAGYGVVAGSTPGVGRDAAGNVTWTDAQGREQPLYPVAADFATLKAEVLKLDANATVRGNGEGLVEIVLNGQSLSLVPDYELVAVPAEHAAEAWWIGADGMLYLRIPSLGKAQGFAVR